MTVTSSYSNNHDASSTKDDDLLTVDRNSRYRRDPVAKVLDDSRDRIAECDRERGHVLKIGDGVIECDRCEARWRDEGF